MYAVQMPDTKITNQSGVERRHGQRVSSSPSFEFTAEAFGRLTLAEILAATGLPARLQHGDADHEGTTEALDGLAVALRHAA